MENTVYNTYKRESLIPKLKNRECFPGDMVMFVLKRLETKTLATTLQTFDSRATNFILVYFPFIFANYDSKLC